MNKFMELSQFFAAHGLMAELILCMDRTARLTLVGPNGGLHYIFDDLRKATPAACAEILGKMALQLKDA